LIRWQRDVSKRGRRASTWRRARAAIWRQFVSVLGVADAPRHAIRDREQERPQLLVRRVEIHRGHDETTAALVTAG